MCIYVYPCVYILCIVCMHIYVYVYIYLYIYIYIDSCPDASVVHSSGTRQLQAIPSVVGRRLSHGKSNQRAVTTMGFNDLVDGEDHMVGPSCRRYDWQTGR